MWTLTPYLGSEGGPPAGRAEGSMGGEGHGQTPGPVLAGLVLAHQPALWEDGSRITSTVRRSNCSRGGEDET